MQAVDEFGDGGGMREYSEMVGAEAERAELTALLAARRRLLGDDSTDAEVAKAAAADAAAAEAAAAEAASRAGAEAERRAAAAAKKKERMDEKMRAYQVRLTRRAHKYFPVRRAGVNTVRLSASSSSRPTAWTAAAAARPARW